MQHLGSFGRSVVLAASLLSACAAAQPTAATGDNGMPRRIVGRDTPTGGPAAFLAGRYAESEGDFGYGADEFMRALAAEPNDPDIRRQAFLAALLAHLPEAAELAREEPSNPAAQLYLADLQAARGNWDAAERGYASLPRQGLTDMLRALLISWAELGAGRSQSSQAEQHPYTDNEHVRGVYTFHDALIADLAGRNADAGRLYAAAAKEFGQPNLDLLRAYASWQARQGQLDAAHKTVGEIEGMGDELSVAIPRLTADVAQRPIRNATDGIAEVYLTFAVLLRQQDSPEFSNVMLRLALDLRPDFTAARLVGAEALEQAHHPEQALEMLASVPADDPLAPSVDLRRAALQDRLGNTEEALKILARVEAAYPSRPEPWSLQGAILRGTHRYAEAVTAFTKALALMGAPAKEQWGIYYERGIAEERSHQWPAAQADFEQALKLSPDEPSVLNYLGYSWTEQGRNLAEAHRMIAKAAEERPNDGAIVDSLGWVELRQGDVAEAVASLEKAVEMEPEDPTINGHLGDAYWAAGRKLEAQYQWRRALTLNPEPEDKAHFEARLHEAELANGTGATAAKTQP